MPNLLAMSFEGELAPSLDLVCLHAGHKLPDGWGIGYYPGGEPSAVVLKEPAPPEGSIRSELVKAWEHLASSLFVLHIRTATWGGLSDANTQPFSRSFGGRDWMLAHAGSMETRLPTPLDVRFEPVGSTDTELLFCQLLHRAAERGFRSIGDIPPEELRAWFVAQNAGGSVNVVLTDGRDLCAYADAFGQGGIFLWQVLPPYESISFGDDDLEIDLTRRGAKSRKGVLLSTEPLRELAGSLPAKWKQLAPGSLIIVRQGAVCTEIGAEEAGTGTVDSSAERAKTGGAAATTAPPRQSTAAPNGITVASKPAIELSTFTFRPNKVKPPGVAARKRFRVYHRTTYRYTKAIERSTQLLRLVPAHDRMQTLLQNEVTISVDGKMRDYQDVFGNTTRRVLLETPYNELIIEAKSLVETLDTDPVAFRVPHARSTIPLVWMPWQRQALEPFLLPVELPESELQELVEYAMSFVTRNGSDLLDTLLDINNSIFREYEYRQGATSLATTPFNVYVTRRGVCQDFTNLFMCMARLLGVPARYTCGYIYTGPKNPNQRQAEASHAWSQVYLPEVGWIGFDPTNGCITQTDHVRVAVGRNYRDATPTSGTIYVGGGGTETLEVEVRVTPQAIEGQP